MSKILVDITDVLAWRRTNQAVTGIQRVVIQTFFSSYFIHNENVQFIERSALGLRLVPKTTIRDFLGKLETAQNDYEVKRAQQEQFLPLKLARLLQVAIARPEKVLPYLAKNFFPFGLIFILFFIAFLPFALISVWLAYRLPFFNLSRDHYQPAKTDKIILCGAFWSIADNVSYYSRMKSKVGVELVTYIYDLIPLSHPQYCHQDFAREFQHQLAGITKISDRFIVISEHVRQELSTYLHTNKLGDKDIFTTRFGFEFNTSQRKKRTDIDLVEKLKLKQHGFFLFVGTLDPRKNPILLLDVWSKLLEKYSTKTPKLVFAGRPGHDMQEFEEYAERLNQHTPDKIVVLGETTDPELEQLYQGSLGLIFPSFVEGWGLPVEEALYFGKYVLASNSSSIPEAGRNAAFYFSPEDGHRLFQEIVSILENDGYLASKEKLARTTARKLSKELSWEQTAIQVTQYVMES